MHRSLSILRLIVAGTALALALLAAPAALAQGDYQFITIDAPGAVNTEAYGINNRGLVSGDYIDALGIYHGFLWKDGVLTTVDHPSGAPNTLFGPANNPGMVVGNFGDFSLGIQHAAVYDSHRGTWTTLPDIPGKPVNIGDGINNAGTAAGSAFEPGFVNGVGWVWDGSAYSLFTVPGSGGFGTLANGINERGQVAGEYQDINGLFHGFVKDGASISTLDAPGAEVTAAFGINNRGDIVGYFVAGGEHHGFVLSKGHFITVDVPGAPTHVYDNNDRGDLAGGYFDAAVGEVRGFVAIRIKR